MIRPLQYKTAIKINKCIKTNSVPFELLCEDGEVYYAKTMFTNQAPFEDLINEIICNYSLQCWSIKVASPNIISIPQHVYDSFIEEDNESDDRYDSVDFDSKLFFGTQRVIATELEMYHSRIASRADFNKYINPTDLIKIAIFDHWIGNKDRRPKNPNILMMNSEGGFEFVAIDHTQAFGYQRNYKDLKPFLMDMPRDNTILQTPISKSILAFADSDFIDNFEKEVGFCIQQTIDHLAVIFDQIPSQLGLSKQGKAKIKEILSLADRNQAIVRLFKSYLV